MSTLRFVGLAVHAETIAVCVPEATGELRTLGRCHPPSQKSLSLSGYVLQPQPNTIFQAQGVGDPHWKSAAVFWPLCPCEPGLFEAIPPFDVSFSVIA
jgi:hypothetical protein